MEGKHTPGPWFFRHSAPTISDLEVVSGEPTVPGSILAVLPSGRRGVSTFEDRLANARLFAAAPELLEACEAILVEWEAMERVHGGREVAMARAAIAKAKGEDHA